MGITKGDTKFTEIRFLHQDGTYGSKLPNPKLKKMMEEWLNTKYPSKDGSNN